MRNLQTETGGKPHELMPAAPRQGLRLAAGQQEKARRVPVATVWQGSEHRERMRNHLPNAFQIVL
jgi:hypothetical protein